MPVGVRTTDRYVSTNLPLSAGKRLRLTRNRPCGWRWVHSSALKIEQELGCQGIEASRLYGVSCIQICSCITLSANKIINEGYPPRKSCKKTTVNANPRCIHPVAINYWSCCQNCRYFLETQDSLLRNSPRSSRQRATCKV